MPIIDRVKIGETIYFVRDNQLASAIIANEYDSSSQYYIGEYCTYENLVYKCIYEISSPEEWNSNHWSNIRVLNEITDKADRTDTVLNSTLSRGRAISTVVGTGSIAFGFNVEGSGDFSEAKGYATVASGDCSTARGTGTKAVENNSNVFGRYNIPDVVDYPEWEANTNYAVGDHIKITDDPYVTYYACIVANNDAEFDANNWEEVAKPEGHLEVVGNGMADNDRSNARALDFDGNEYLNGNVYVHCDDDSEGGIPVSTMIYLSDYCTTKALIFDKLSRLAIGESATINITSDAMAVLSGGVSTSASNVGVVSCHGNGVYDFICKYGSALSIKTARLSGATSASSQWTWTERYYGQKITLSNSYNTWSAIWDEISKLASNESALFYAHATAFKIISRNARNETCVGVITRMNTSGSDFIYTVTCGSSTNRVPLSAYVTGASSSSEGTYYEYDVKSEIDDLNTDVAKVVDRELKSYYLTADGATSTINLTSNSRYLIIIDSTAASVKELLIVSTSSAGAVGVARVLNASNIVIDTATANKLKITNNATISGRAYVETLPN